MNTMTRRRLHNVYFARVTGRVVANEKTPNLKGTALLLVQPLDSNGADVGKKHVAIDTVRAGVGDIVSCVGSREAALSHDPTFVPVDASIIGIVDDAPDGMGDTARGGRR